MTQSVLFVCPHGVAKSVLAWAAFEQLAAESGVDAAAGAVGLTPDPAVPPAVVELLQHAGIDLGGYQPRGVTQGDITASSRIVTLGCALTAFDLTGTVVESWTDVPLASQDLPGAWDAIRAHVAQLVTDMQAGERAARR